MNESKQVRRALKKLGFSKLTGAGGHEVWVNGSGKRVRPVLRHKNMNFGALYALSEQLEGLGVCTKADFKRIMERV